MSPQVIVALIIALCGFGSAWKIQDWRYAAKEAEHVQQELADQHTAATTAIRRTEAVIAAQSAAAVRATALRRDADGMRSSLISLSLATEQALRDAESSQSACIANSAQLANVFGACSSRYERVAGEADLWESHAKTLEDGWPK